MKLSRRPLLRGALAALAATAARPVRAAARPSPARPPARACILLYMHGGASQLDTFDPKPGRPTGGPFASIPTRLPGVHVSEHLPRLAARLHRVALVRTLTSTEGNHARARYLMHTGYAPAGATPHPSFGALVSAARPTTDLPGHVAIGTPGHGAGLLGARHGPFVVRRAAPGVRNLTPARPVPSDRARDRARLSAALHDDFAADRTDPIVAEHADLLAAGRRLMASPAAAAFDLSHEPDALRDRYGRHDFGQGCLLARRLVEAGVAFVEVGLRGWDTHADNFTRVADLCAELDTGLAALLDDLDDRGRLDETLVLWLGDFGRSPRVNARGGRDHFPRIASALLAGGGLEAGVVVGRTDDDGEEIVDDPVTVPDLWRTVAVRLGLDPDHTRMTAGGRPLSTVDGGRVIGALT